MTAKNTETSDSQAINQPDELNALRAVMKEFITRLETIDNELETLKGDRKELIEEFKEKLDVKAMATALRIVKMKRSTQSPHTLETMLEILEDRGEDAV